MTIGLEHYLVVSVMLFVLGVAGVIVRRNLLVEILLRAQPAIAGIGIDAEIADHQRGDGVKRERVEDGAEPLPGHHGATLPALR